MAQVFPMAYYHNLHLLNINQHSKGVDVASILNTAYIQENGRRKRRADEEQRRYEFEEE